MFKYHIVAKLVGEIKNSNIPARVKINEFKWALHLFIKREVKKNYKQAQ